MITDRNFNDEYPQSLKETAVSTIKRNSRSNKLAAIIRNHRLRSQKERLGRYFIGNTRNLYDLINIIDAHKSHCEGRLITRSRNFISKNLALKVRLNCSMKDKCCLWGVNYGLFIYNSDEIIPVTLNDRTVVVEYVCNLKQPLASLATPARRKTVRQVLQCFQLTSISKQRENRLLRNLYYPKTKEWYDSIVKSKFRTLKERKYLVFGMDTSFDCVRYATAATI